MRTLVSLAVLALWTTAARAQTTKLLASDGELLDRFGSSVAMSDATIIVGASRDSDNGIDSGSAYLFNLGTGGQYAKLLASDGTEGNWFGHSVGVSGTTAVVGAPGDGLHSFQGAAYLFSASTGIESFRLSSLDSIAITQSFGTSVATNGEVAAVGAPEGGPSNAHRGAVYLFDCLTGGQVDKLVASDAAVGRQFGASVALSASRIAVGSPGVNSNSPTQVVSAYLFDAATGAELLRLRGTPGHPSDRFGHSIAVSDDLVVVGAPWDDDNGTSSGSAFVFDAGTGAQLWRLHPIDGESGHQFGWSVAISGEKVVVGARLEGFQGEAAGAAYIFDAGTGTQIERLLAPDGDSGDHYGVAVAAGGSMAVVGAELDDDNGLDAGSAYLLDTSSPQVHTGYAYCFGDGTGAACPCGGLGNLGEGCANSAGLGGASLRGEGHASISADSFLLDVQGVPGSKPGLILRGDNQLANGWGAPVGDGLLCAAGQSARSHVQITSAGSTSFNDVNGAGFGTWTYGVGTRVNYQFWYRDPQNACSGLGFNWTNAWAVTWIP